MTVCHRAHNLRAMHARATQPEKQDRPEERHSYVQVRHDRSAASPVVHVLKTAIMLSPLIASEFVKDPSRTFKWSRIAIGGATLLDQVDYAMRCSRDNERQREDRTWADRCRPSGTEQAVQR